MTVDGSTVGMGIDYRRRRLHVYHSILWLRRFLWFDGRLRFGRLRRCHRLERRVARGNEWREHALEFDMVEVAARRIRLAERVNPSENSKTFLKYGLVIPVHVPVSDKHRMRDTNEPQAPHTA